MPESASILVPTSYKYDRNVATIFIDLIISYHIPPLFRRVLILKSGTSAASKYRGRPNTGGVLIPKIHSFEKYNLLL